MRPIRPWNHLILSLSAIIVLAAAPAPGEEAPTPASRVDELFSDWNRSDAPGAAVAVFQNGRIVYENAFGMADLERGVRLTPRSVFEIGSVSKQFTAMCILLLEHDGKLSLGDDIRTHVPEMPAYERPITVRQLLHHTSGIRDIETLLPMAGMPYVNHYSEARLLDLVTRQKGLNFPPGSEHLYSNSGYLLLAHIVERASGKSLRRFAQERIFGPLGMRHTAFWGDPAQLVPGRALAYSPDGQGGYGLEMWNCPFAGPAGVYSTVADLARWDANFYDNKLGGGAALIEAMETPGTLEDGQPIDYAAGLFVGDFREHRVIEHDGAWMGYRTELMRLPGEHLTIAVLSNAASIDVSARSVAEVYLGASKDAAEPQAEPDAAPFETPATIELPLDSLGDYVGTYWNPAHPMLRKIEVRDGKLFYVRSADSVTGLGALESGRFIMLGMRIRVDVEFDSAPEGEEKTMIVTVEGREPLHFERLETPSDGELASYAGDYWSEELERVLRLRLDQGRISVSWADDSRSVPAEIVGSDELLVQGFIEIPWFPQDARIRLGRDASDRITGLSLSCRMVRGISFDRVNR